MIMFLLIFLLVYGGLHLYMFLKAKAALGFGATSGIFVVIFLVLMVFAPILTRMLERPGLEPIARVLAYVGYTWMGLLGLFFCISIVIDVLHAGSGGVPGAICPMGGGSVYVGVLDMARMLVLPAGDLVAVMPAGLIQHA